MSRLDGAAAGFRINVTNSGSCDLHAEEVTVTVHTTTYRDGTTDTLEFTETQRTPDTILPGKTALVDFTFDYIFKSTPTGMSMRVEILFRETGSIAVFDGEIQIPVRG